jgi:hypothetical protein
MKVGDYIHCYKTGYMNDGIEDDEIFAIAGKDYLVTDIRGDDIQITSELGPGHVWTLDEMFDEYFRYNEPKKGYLKWADSKIVFKFV